MLEVIGLDTVSVYAFNAVKQCPMCGHPFARATGVAAVPPQPRRRIGCFVCSWPAVEQMGASVSICAECPSCGWAWLEAPFYLSQK